MSNKYEITDYQWGKIEPCIPKKTSTCGRARRDPIELINAIIWVLRTGSPWCEIPERYGSWRTAYNNFRKWEEKGVREKIFNAVMPKSNEIEEIQVDSTIVRVHQHGTGAKKGILERGHRMKG